MQTQDYSPILHDCSNLSSQVNSVAARKENLFVCRGRLQFQVQLPVYMQQAHSSLDFRL